MPPINNYIPSSVLNRLVTGTSYNSDGGIGQLKQSVKENLEWLLNTTQATTYKPSNKRNGEKEQEDDPAKKWPQVCRSVAAYGLPEFSQLNPNNEADCDYICEVLKDAIELFEPRLDQVRVTLAKEKEGEGGSQENKKYKQTIGFEIRALLRVEPRPELVVFDAKSDARHGKYEVKET